MRTLEPDLLQSFVAIAESGSFTAAAVRVHRTQSAVSMQIKRLEEQVGRALFARDGRGVGLTRDGEQLLGHARRILKAHQEAVTSFDLDALEGGVTLGAPHDYAGPFLPRILCRFAETHPKVHVDVVCEPSIDLLAKLASGKIDLAMITQGSGENGGVLLHQEPLAWMSHSGHDVHRLDPLPLALFQPGCSFRRAATEALASVGRNVRIAYTSVSIAGIYAVLDAGLAVSALCRSNLRPGLRILDEAEGFPPLPDVGITLQRAAGKVSPVVDRLEEHIIASMAGVRPLALAA